MSDQLFQYIIVFSIGLFVYLKDSRSLFIYWLSVQPIIMPIYFRLFPVSIEEEFGELYAKGVSPVSYLCFFIFLFELLKGRVDLKKDRRLLLSATLVVIYIAFQNFIVHFDIPTIKNGFTMILHIIMPLLLLLNCERVRPKKEALIRFSYFIIVVQLLFCCLNLFGFKAYPTFFEEGRYENHLISGTFARFNHLTNYLSTLFLFISVEFYYYKKLGKKDYYIMALLIGIMILMSGSRLSLILYIFIILAFLYIYKRRKFYILFICLISLLIVYGFSASLSKSTIEEQDQASGIQRNVMGLTSFFQSDITEGNSTASLSTYLLLFEFHNPILGNGYAYMGEDGYDRGDFANQSVFIADAHLAYMIVEYGILGCLVFCFFYINIFKTVTTRKIIRNSNVIKIIAIYYILNTITDIGLFDISLLSFLYIFSFTQDNMLNNTQRLRLQ